MNESRVRCGAHYCEICKKCTRLPRLRKNWQPDYYHVCEECEPDVLTVEFCPDEDSPKTMFKIRIQDLPRLIDQLSDLQKMNSLIPVDSTP